MTGARATGSESRNPYADVQVELTAMIFDRVLPTVVTGGVIMMALTGATAYHYHYAKTWWLVAVMGALWIGRLSIVLRFPSDPLHTLTPKTAERWEKLYGYYTALYMSSMGASTLLSMAAPDSVHFMYCVFGTFALCNAIGARLGTRPRMVMLQASLMLVAIVAAILRQKGIMARCSALVVFAYAFTFWESIRIKFDITVDQLRGRRQQRHLAEHDALTGLANRRHFEERLAALCNEKQTFAVFFLDLDGFKRVNDAHGHATGDLLLQHVAERLQGTVRDDDVLARLGGDEFAILQTSHATRESAGALATRLIERVSVPYQIDDRDLRIGTSIGIRLSGPHDIDPDILLRQADNALYAVKESAKGSFHFAEETREPQPSAQTGKPRLLTARPGCA